jgi:carbamoyltransferase
VHRNYIGLATSFHDSALAILNSSGDVLFAEATERSLQSKRSLCMVPDILHRTGDLIEAYCERDAEIVVAHSWSGLPQTSVTDLLRHMEEGKRAFEHQFGTLPDSLREEFASLGHSSIAQWAMTSFSGQNLNYELSRIRWKGGIPAITRRYDHHLTHAAAACYSSGLKRALCAIVDGLGEDRSCAFYRFDNGQLTPILPNGDGRGSLGMFYLSVCVACGFGMWTGEEWKVMGLAAYGRRDESLVELFRRMIRVNGLTLEYDGSFDLRRALEKVRRRPGEPPIAAANLAYAGQLVFTETILQLLRNLHNQGFSDNLILSGGCALNSSANGEILQNTPFKHLYVFHAPGDDGNAVGAARLAYLEDHPNFSLQDKIQSPYLGSTVSEETKNNILRFRGNLNAINCDGRAPQTAARLLADGKIIGWMQGSAEFGPRALGNRSILADPRARDIKEKINGRVKFREEYRPFAPSILHEHGPDYFPDYQESPYMDRTLKFRSDVAERVPGVVHVDGTGRLQTVKSEWNPKFHKLIHEFFLLTGIPLVLNTSLNIMGKPIAHSVEDGLALFCSTGLDALFIDDVLITK